MDRIKLYFYYLDSQFIGYAPIIRITVYMVIILLLLYLSSLLRLLITNRTINKRNRRKEDLYYKYEDKIREVVYSHVNLDSDDIRDQINIEKKDSKRKWQKILFSTLLVKIRKENKDDINISNYN